MKKYILLVGAMLLSLCGFAQTRQYMGAYTSDTYDSDGLGATGYPGNTSVVADIPTSLLSVYDGGKVVGMRFAVAQTANTKKCFILNATDTKVDTLAVAHLSSTKVGWNEVEFEKPFILDLSKITYLFMGYDYEQTSSNYPLSLVNEGIICPSYLYGNFGQGTDFYDFGLDSYGNLSVQAIVEKNFDNYSITAYDFEDFYSKKDEPANITLDLQNTGSATVKDLDYIVTVDGTVIEEKHLALTKSISSFGEFFQVNIPFETKQDLGSHAISIKINKVNGVANESKANVAEGKITLLQKLFKHRVVMEQHTGTGCGWCVRGHQAMANLRETFGDDFIGIALHQYSNSTRDAMNLNSANYKRLSFGGAPSARIERGEEMDPYYGSTNDIREDVRKALKVVSPVEIELKAGWNLMKDKVTACATVEAITNDKTYDIEFVLVADDLKGTTSAWAQSNFYIQYSSSSLPSDLAKYGSGGSMGSNPISGYVFNDVAISSSYTNNYNNATSLGQLEPNTPVENTCTLSLPTSKTLLQALNYSKIYCVAMVIDKSTGKIVNADKCEIGNASNIESITEGKPSQNAPIYNISGQKVGANYKGIVIKNGHKYFQK